MLVSATSGFSLGFGLILAIGAQNAFVLRQGIRRAHVFWVCLTCAISDAVLIVAGVAGFGALAQAVPAFEAVMRFGGAAFLLAYGARSFYAAWRGGEALKAGGPVEQGLGATLLVLLGITWLNPHVYLDTVVLLGSVSAQYPDRVAFALGGMTASTVFFFALGYGARVLAPVFATPRAWRILDGIIGATMWVIAVKLLIM